MLKAKSDKLEPKTKIYLFVGYPKGTRGGLFCSLEDNKVFVRTNTKFLEEDYVKNFKSKLWWFLMKYQILVQGKL